MTLDELREQDNRRLFIPDGIRRTIGDTPDVMSLLVRDSGRNTAARIAAGSYAQHVRLICLTIDLPAVPVPGQQLTIDGVYYLVGEPVIDEAGLLDITLTTRRA